MAVVPGVTAVPGGPASVLANRSIGMASPGSVAPASASVESTITWRTRGRLGCSGVNASSNSAPMTSAWVSEWPRMYASPSPRNAMLIGTA